VTPGSVMRPLLFFATLLVLLWSESVYASWQQYAQAQPVAAIDFYDEHHGIVVFGNGPIEIFHDSTFKAVSTNHVDQVLIQDSDRAWAFDRFNQVLYRGSNRWTKWDSTALSLPQNTQLLAATPRGLFFETDSGLFYTVTGDTSIQVNIGVKIVAMDYLSSSQYVAVSNNYALISTDGGMTWMITFPSMTNCKSLFVDRARGWIYIGGDQLRRSIDSGKTWTTIQPPAELPINALSGQVFGVHDCTGVIYVAGVNSIYRSRDQGQSFEEVGPSLSIPAFIRQSIWAFDRGSTIFWKSDYFGSMTVSYDGIDGILTDSVIRELAFISDTITDTACATPTNLTLSVLSSTCAPVRIDSISLRSSTGRITTTITPRVLNGDSATFDLLYAARKAGLDSIVLRVWFHGIEGAITEHQDIVALAYDYSLPAILTSPDSISFGSVHIDSTRQSVFSVSNAGCAPLRIDSIRSSDPNVFAISHHTYPIVLASDSSVSFLMTFTPVHTGQAVESLEIGTNAGHRFIALMGTGYTSQNVVSSVSAPVLTVYPNPASQVLYISSPLIGSTYTLYDLLGRAVAHGNITHNEEEVLLNGLTSGVYVIDVGGVKQQIVISHP